MGLNCANCGHGIDRDNPGVFTYTGSFDSNVQGDEEVQVLEGKLPLNPEKLSCVCERCLAGHLSKIDRPWRECGENKPGTDIMCQNHVGHEIPHWSYVNGTLHEWSDSSQRVIDRKEQEYVAKVENMLKFICTRNCCKGRCSLSEVKAEENQKYLVKTGGSGSIVKWLATEGETSFIEDALIVDIDDLETFPLSGEFEMVPIKDVMKKARTVYVDV